MLARLPSEAGMGMVTTSEGCVIVCSNIGVGSVGIMPGLFARVTLWCVRGAKSI